MAEDKYTKAFKLALCSEINELLAEEWQLEDFVASTEHGKDMLGAFNGYIDIGIIDQTNNLALVGIEIEHYSGSSQANQNVNKIKTWAHNSTKRKCGLLHIFNEYCYLDEDDICALTEFAKKNEARGLGFYYDYVFYAAPKDISPKVASVVAKQMVGSKNFRTRLYQLLNFVGLCNLVKKI